MLVFKTMATWGSPILGNQPYDCCVVFIQVCLKMRWTSKSGAILILAKMLLNLARGSHCSDKATYPMTEKLNVVKV